MNKGSVSYHYYYCRKYTKSICNKNVESFNTQLKLMVNHLKSIDPSI